MESSPVEGRLTAVAQAHVDRHAARGGGRTSMADVRDAVLRWDEDYARRVAAYFDRAPLLVPDVRLALRYAGFIRENAEQYAAIAAAGIVVRPWLRPGQPYRTAAELIESVRCTETLYVYLTRSGHGPGPAPRGHPLVAPAGIHVDGVELCHNDVFRAVHDIFGHVMCGNGFSIRGEFRASHCHLRMYSEEVRTVVFTEQVAQICWYFFGPQAGRRYPEQKVFEFPAGYVTEFQDLFATGRTEEPT